MTLDYNWAKRAKWLTQALILSGTLNVALIATFAYFSLKEKELSCVLEHPLKPPEAKAPTNIELLRSYSILPYQELILRLENKELVEQGFTKRDLSLSCLSAFHHFNIDKALGGIPLKKREVSFTNPSRQETLTLPLFAGLTDTQFLAIINYAKTEKWPLTSQGLFYELTRNTDSQDPSLIEAFVLTPEYQSVKTLCSSFPKEDLLQLMKEGSWEQIRTLYEEQKTTLDLSVDKKRSFLSSYLDNHSKTAATLLIQNEVEFVEKRLSDSQLLTLLDLCCSHTPQLEQLAKQLLLSPRTEPVWKKAAALLYSFKGESYPEPYDHALSVKRFCPEKITIQQATPSPNASLQINNTVQKTLIHTVAPGENLWKIAKKYRVSIEAIMKCNHLETDKVRPGKQLQIPQGTGSHPPAQKG
ncbi:MAG: hypothetical protein RLZZ453_690 [Chlamydiota bacterium]|jgi:hypothetical protein